MGSERDFDRLRKKYKKRGSSKSPKYSDPESMEEVQGTEGKGVQSSEGRLGATSDRNGAEVGGDGVYLGPPSLPPPQKSADTDHPSGAFSYLELTSAWSPLPP